MENLAAIKAKYYALSARLDEATLRIWAAAEARSLGHGGVSAVAKASGLSRTTIHAGLAELKAMPSSFPSLEISGCRRVRATGGGRKRLIDKDEQLLRDLDTLVEPASHSDPTSPLRWTSKSTHRLAAELQRQGHSVSQRTVCDLLGQMGYRLQSTRKTREGTRHNDRDAQFTHIAQTAADYQASGDPVISVDTKKKELIGDFKNAGRGWQPEGSPEPVRGHGFIDPELGEVALYGVYNLTANAGWVSAGIDHDAVEFAVESVRRWWKEMGTPIYPDARRLMITADCGGGNGYRARLWRRELQTLADELRLTIHVCHFPPGTSKWNKIEHRMFCHITANWHGRPLIRRQVVVNLIGNTTTQTGLRIQAARDENTCVAGVKAANEELTTLAIERDEVHGEWNYRLQPRDKPART